MKRRSQGRVLAMQYLFSRDSSGEWTADGFPEFAYEQKAAPDVRDFAERIVTGALEHRSELIQVIEEVTRNWRCARMPMVDRNLLLIGSWEILHAPDIPANVTINEIVELAKTFSTESSGAFVNGVLDSLKERQAETHPS